MAQDPPSKAPQQDYAPSPNPTKRWPSRPECEHGSSVARPEQNCLPTRRGDGARHDHQPELPVTDQVRLPPRRSKSSASSEQEGYGLHFASYASNGHALQKLRCASFSPCLSARRFRDPPGAQMARSQAPERGGFRVFPAGKSPSHGHLCLVVLSGPRSIDSSSACGESCGPLRAFAVIQAFWYNISKLLGSPRQPLAGQARPAPVCLSTMEDVSCNSLQESSS